VNERKMLQERIEASRDTMATRGWEYMHQGWSEELKNLIESTLPAAKTLEDLWFRKGAASVLDRLVKLADYLDAVEKLIAEGDEQESAE